jgi:hypothetical protein
MKPNVDIEEISCSYPKAKFPYYHVDIRLNNDSDNDYYINKLWINGSGCRDYVIFRGKDFVYNPYIKGRNVTDIIARADWENDSEVRAELELISADGNTRFNVSHRCRAPPYGGYWNKNWKYYFSIVVEEEDNLSRVNYPIHTTISLYKDRVTDIKKELRMVEIDTMTGVPKEIPSQISEVHVCETEPDETKQPSVSFDLSFYANLEPHENKVYLGFYGNPSADAPNYGLGLKISGNGLGKTVENDYYKIKLHPKSGVIDEITLKRGKDKTFLHKIETNGAVHWNPGIYSPPRPWTHTSDWDPPEGSSFESGPIFTKIKLWGKLPFYPETMASITYVFYSRLPFVRMSSTLNIIEDISVQAMRNGEIVLNHDLAKEFAWRNKHGDINTVTIKDLPRFAEVPLTIAADTPWTTFYNSDFNVALGSMTLNLANMRNIDGLVKLEKYEQMLNWGPWVYVSRTLVCPFLSQNPQRMVFIPKSSTYFEDMAFMPFVLHESESKLERFQEIEYWYKRLINPLSLTVEMDTDKRVPAEFVLGERLEGRIKETEELTIPIEVNNNFTRFRQSPVLLNEKMFGKIRIAKS